MKRERVKVKEMKKKTSECMKKKEEVSLGGGGMETAEGLVDFKKYFLL